MRSRISEMSFTSPSVPDAGCFDAHEVTWKASYPRSAATHGAFPHRAVYVTKPGVAPGSTASNSSCIRCQAAETELIVAACRSGTMLLLLNDHIRRTAKVAGMSKTISCRPGQTGDLVAAECTRSPVLTASNYLESLARSRDLH